ncbi:hypothetical protein KYB31_14065 [Clostridium felsineum]|uniref:hypothetical protein n=1 Tax=Clostridium felsineum TaxID=36839 RepID=UPI00214D29C7|nr:hypothetical protein [Clostridium felsineum]MCR3760099.1 hypothetical protein [Clostridium felsineum]
MYGYRDYARRRSFGFRCPYLGYRPKVEEYPAQYQNHPQNPPPTYIPKMPQVTVGTNTINICTDKYTYLWLNNGDAFWAYIVYIGTQSISGWRYERGVWRQFGVNLSQIKSFLCV